MAKKTVTVGRMNKEKKTGRLYIPEDLMIKAEILFGEETDPYYDFASGEIRFKRLHIPELIGKKLTTGLEDLDDQFYARYPEFDVNFDDDNNLPSNFWKHYSDDLQLTALEMFSRAIIVTNPVCEWSTEIIRLQKIIREKNKKRNEAIQKPVALPVVIEQPVEDTHRAIMRNLYHTMDKKPRQRSYVDSKLKLFATRANVDKIEFVDLTEEHLAQFDQTQVSEEIKEYLVSRGIVSKVDDST